MRKPEIGGGSVRSCSKFPSSSLREKSYTSAVEQPLSDAAQAAAMQTRPDSTGIKDCCSIETPSGCAHSMLLNRHVQRQHMLLYNRHVKAAYAAVEYVGPAPTKTAVGQTSSRKAQAAIEQSRPGAAQAACGHKHVQPDESAVEQTNPEAVQFACRTDTSSGSTCCRTIYMSLSR